MIIGVGCDIVQIDRIKQAMKDERFLRILTSEELKLYSALTNERQVEWLAGRFAAKEAVIKAVSSHKNVVLSDVSILYDNKRPVCVMDGIQIHLSISHEKEYAVAYAIAQEN